MIIISLILGLWLISRILSIRFPNWEYWSFTGTLGSYDLYVGLEWVPRDPTIFAIDLSLKSDISYLSAEIVGGIFYLELNQIRWAT